MTTMKISKPNIEILADEDSVAGKCLALFISAIDRVLKTADVFNLAISGGHTPAKFFKLLTEDPSAKTIPWKKINVFWVDERYVPHESPLSNYKLATDTFLSKIPIPKENIHPIETNFEAFDQAARQYEDTIRSVFNIKKGQMPQFDFILLGMGADGHTASLFPNSNALADTNDLACVVYLIDQKQPKEALTRITLTHPVLRAASQIIILVTGSEKAETLKDVLTNSPNEMKYPIHLLWPSLDKITWLIDSPAAKLL
jgi:6-phosphogluconolactonase